MGFAYLVNIVAAIKAFKVKYNIPRDVLIEYCPEGDIEDERMPRVIFILLMTVQEGGVRFSLNPLLLGTLRFYGLNPDQCLLNFYRAVAPVNRLIRLYKLRSTHHDINFLYSCCGNLKNNYYLKVRDPQIRLISYFLDSNKNSQGEFIKVSKNWLTDELTCPTSL